MPNFSKLSPVTVILALLAACGDTSTSNEANLEEVARGIHERVITLDTHADINTENFTPENNYTQDLDTQVNLPKMEAGGLDVAWFIVYTGQDFFSKDLDLEPVPFFRVEAEGALPLDARQVRNG